MIQNKHKRWPGGVFLFSLVLLFMDAGTVLSQSSANYKIKISVLDHAGGPSQSANFKAIDVIGQPSPVTVANSANYSVASGFLGDGATVQTPVLLVTPTTLNFDATQTSLTFQISNSGSGTLTWNASENPDKPWITSVAPASGSSNATVTVSVDRSGLSAGNYSGRVTVTSNGGSMDVTVNMTVDGAGATWENQESGTENRLFAVTAISDLVAWVVGANGTVLRTIDGGNVWANVWKGSETLPIYAVAALDANTAFVAPWDQSASNALIYQTNNGGLSWTVVFQQTNGFVNNIAMFNQNDGMALGDPVAGIWTILKTTDGGNNWTAMSHPPAALEGDYSSTRSIVWADQSTGWFASNKSKLFHTSNGGTTWDERSIQVLPNVNGIAFSKNGVGMAEYYQGQLARTFDGGLNWETISSPGDGTIYLPLFHQNKFWLLRNNSIYNSKDTGETWELQTQANENLRYLSLVTNQQGTYGWAVGNNGIILKYKDEATQGPTIKPVISSIFGDNIIVDILVSNVTGLYGLSFDFVYHDNSNAIAAQNVLPEPFFGSDIIFFPNINRSTKTVGVGLSRKPGQGGINGTGNVAQISLSGYESTPFETSVSFELQNVTANDENGNPIIFTVEPTDPLITDVHAEQAVLPESFKLHQNYPNPFNPETHIGYELPRSATVAIKVLNLLGQEIRTLVNEDKPAGFHEATWDGKDRSGQRVASGVYLYRIEAAGFVQVKKLVLLR